MPSSSNWNWNPLERVQTPRATTHLPHFDFSSEGDVVPLAGAVFAKQAHFEPDRIWSERNGSERNGIRLAGWLTGWIGPRP